MSPPLLWPHQYTSTTLRVSFFSPDPAGGAEVCLCRWDLRRWECRARLGTVAIAGLQLVGAHRPPPTPLPGTTWARQIHCTALNCPGIYYSAQQRTALNSTLLSCILMHCICNLLHLLQANQLAHNTCSRHKLLHVALGQNRPMRAARLNGLQIHNVRMPLWL